MLVQPTADSRHVGVCCRRETGAEYISANKNYFTFPITWPNEDLSIFSETNSVLKIIFFLEIGETFPC